MSNFNFNMKDIPEGEELIKYFKNDQALNIHSIQACWYLFKTAQELISVVDKQFKDYGVSDGKFSVLMALYKNENHQLVPSEISDTLNVTRATITGLLDTLEKDGLVNRCKHASDRRMLTIKITKKGIKLMDELYPKHFILLSKLLSSLDHESLSSFIGNLKDIRAGIKK